jgi:hypothetical protein
MKIVPSKAWPLIRHYHFLSLLNLKVRRVQCLSDMSCILNSLLHYVSPWMELKSLTCLTGKTITLADYGSSEGKNTYVTTRLQSDLPHKI